MCIYEAGIRKVTQRMANYKVIPSHLSGQNLHLFTFYLRSDKPTKAVLHHCIDTSSQDNTLAFREMDYSVIIAPKP